MKSIFDLIYSLRCLTFLLVCLCIQIHPSNSIPILNSTSTDKITTTTTTKTTEIKDTVIYVDLEITNAQLASMNLTSINLITSNQTESNVIKQRMQDFTVFTEHKNFSSMYSLKLFIDPDTDLTNIDGTIEKQIQLAVLKYFKRRTSDLSVKLIANKLLVPAASTNQIEFKQVQVSLASSFNISPVNVTHALVDFSFNEYECKLNNDSHSISCHSPQRKDAESLLNFIDFWIQLTNSSIMHYSKRRMDYESRPVLTEFDSIYDSFDLIIVLGIMACSLAIVIFVFLIIYVYATKLHSLRDRVYPFGLDLGVVNQSIATTSHVDTGHIISAEQLPPKKPKRAYY